MQPNDEKTENVYTVPQTDTDGKSVVSVKSISTNQLFRAQRETFISVKKASHQTDHKSITHR